MAFRINTSETAGLTVIRLDGRLAGAWIPHLDTACRTAKSPLVLDLTNLMSVDDAGLVLLRRLASEGVHLLGVSSYLSLRLSGPDSKINSEPRR